MGVAPTPTLTQTQRLRLSDGCPLDVTPEGMVWGPYGLALHRAELFVADANHDRILVLDSTRLGEVRRELGGKAQPHSHA